MHPAMGPWRVPVPDWAIILYGLLALLALCLLCYALWRDGLKW